MRRALVTLGLVLLVALGLGGGCSCGGEAEREAPVPVDVDLGPSPTSEEAPVPGPVYKRAYDNALKQLDADSARDRLREIEKDISREQRGLP